MRWRAQIIDHFASAPHTRAHAHGHAARCFRPGSIRRACAHAGWRALNARLLRECRQLRADDAVGRRWSARNYPGGYTSYSSAHRMHAAVADLRRARAAARPPRAALCAASCTSTCADGALAMTDCWVNIMGAGAAHAWHLHPLATISGTYYVHDAARRAGAQVRGSAPRALHGRPAARRARARRENRPWVSLSAQAGALVLFESWLRHEVAANARDRRARQHQFQLQLVLSDRARGQRAHRPLRCLTSDTAMRELRREFSRGSVWLVQRGG